MDPFLDIIHLLRPWATLWGRIDGVGRWGVSFRKRGDLLFCWVERERARELLCEALALHESMGMKWHACKVAERVAALS